LTPERQHRGGIDSLQERTFYTRSLGTDRDKVYNRNCR